MRYSKIYVSVWDDEKIRKLSLSAKVGYIYLCACPHGNSIGYFRLPISYIAVDLHVSISAATKVLKELENSGLILYNHDSSRVMIVSYLQWNGNTSPKTNGGMANIFDMLPEDRLDECFLKDAKRFCTPLFFERSRRAKEIMEQEGKNGEKRGIDGVSMGHARGIDGVCKGYRWCIDGASTDTDTDTDTDNRVTDNRNSKHYDSLRSSCSEPKIFVSEPDPESEAIEEIPTNRYGSVGEVFRVSQKLLDELQEAYPAVDVRAELKRIKSWSLANGSKRKTLRGMPRFLNLWMSKTQDRAGMPDRQFASRSALPESAVHTEEAWAGIKGGKIDFGGTA